MFVFTRFRDAVLAARIHNADGEVVNGISRRVTTPLVADLGVSPTGKVKKAPKYGIDICSRDNF